MDRGRYYYAERDGITFIKMVGNLKYTTSSGFDRFVEELLEKGFENLLIDLSEATYIDSTNLGLIARLGERARHRNDVHMSIISTNEDINEILRSVRFDRLFTIVESREKVESPLRGAEQREIEDVDSSRREDLEMLAEAHRALMDAHEENRPKFRDVVELLEEEMKDY